MSRCDNSYDLDPVVKPQDDKGRSVKPQDDNVEKNTPQDDTEKPAHDNFFLARYVANK